MKHKANRCIVALSCCLVGLICAGVIGLFQTNLVAQADEKNATDIATTEVIDENTATHSSETQADEANITGKVVVATRLKGGIDAAASNTAYLQMLMNEVSSDGGGTIEIPQGVFKFSAGGSTSSGGYVVKACDNVEIIGAGMDKTVLMPVGLWSETGQHPHGIDMFNYRGDGEEEVLVNADFRDFTINSSLTKGDPRKYNASGKGFYFRHYKDCDWENVRVCNTDGTGFGMDFPINCTVKNCIADGCGKNASENAGGASGFGIGIGASEDESILIENCESNDNTKYGFFFEDQVIFQTDAPARYAEGFVVKDCTAAGNLYNFGAHRGYDVVFKNCKSLISPDPERETYNRFAFDIENHSVRITLENCTAEQKAIDVDSESEYGEAVAFAINNGIATIGAEKATFLPHNPATRAEAATFLWRFAGFPGSAVKGPWEYSFYIADDVSASSYYGDAVNWMIDEGITTSVDAFRPQDPITRGDFVTMLWRYAHGSLAHAPLNGTPSYEVPMRWAFNEGIVSKPDTENNICTRGDMILMLMRYSETQKED